MPISCISYYSYIKPQPLCLWWCARYSCISYYSYIKPQLFVLSTLRLVVVYRTIPTSNHNPHDAFTFDAKLYIVLFLHQTTTDEVTEDQEDSCISYYSYIKPQPHFVCFLMENGCISYYSYIKPQLTIVAGDNKGVVYRTIPTSNHNQFDCFSCFVWLYIVLFLHQTTTIAVISQRISCCISYYSYIKPQRTTNPTNHDQGCISYYSYIKPQLA